MSINSRQGGNQGRNILKAKHDLIVQEKPDSNSDAYSDSFEAESSHSEAEVETLRSDLINKVHQMNLEKLKSVASFIESLEPRQAPGRPKPVIHKGKRPYSGKINEHTCEIEIKVLSTWGHAHLAGLTELEFFNSNQELIKITQSSIHIKNAGGPLTNTSKMIDGEKHTEDDKHMWSIPLPIPPLNLEISVNLPENPSGIRIWNYNKSVLDSVKGIKDVQIFKDKDLVWEGIVKRGCGNKFDNYATDISLSSGFVIKPEVVDKEQDNIPVWVGGKTVEEKRKRDQRMRPVASVPRVMHIPDSDNLDDIRIDRAQVNPQNLNYKKTNATTRERKSEKEEAGLIPEPTLRILGLNSKKKSEPLKESLESLEFFKITNESRIKRERIIVNPSSMPEGKSLIKSKPQTEEKKQRPSDPQDMIEKFLAEQSTPKQQVHDLRMPNMPRGQMIKICIYSTWGDQHYVGLSGIEIFDDMGDPVKFPSPKAQITASPPDVNILPGYGTDPRTIDKLLDGVNWTCDDLHVWLAPFNKGQVNTIQIDLQAIMTISIIRIWNYNKSRIHSFRGAKDLEIFIDNSLIFKGEIQKAPGRILDADQYCEYLVFTREEGIIRRIETFDWVKDFEHNSQADNELMSTIRLQNRPGTASKHVGEDGRPMTSAKIPKPIASSSTIAGRKLRVLILDTWGDAYYVGLTGIQVLGVEGPFAIQRPWIEATPRDMNVIPGYSGDYRTLDKLINNKNQTTDDHNMWLIPYTKGKYHYIDIDLQETSLITGMTFWNYNKNPEDTSRGVKDLIIYLDGKQVTEPNITLRKAPGNSEFDFGQSFSLPYKDQQSSEKAQKLFASAYIKQDYETPCLPSGYILTIKFLSTWGDMHYIGLNGIEVFDSMGKEIISSGIGCRVAAKPNSVRDLADMNEDVRTPDKLIDGVNNTKDDRHMWLAPFQTPGTYFNMNGGLANEVSLIFEKKVVFGYIRIWNYAKTPSRGVKEVMMLIDDAIVYKGFLRQNGPSVILFTGEQIICARVADQVYLHEGDKVNVLLYNEGKLVGGLDQPKVVAERPMTSVVKQYS